MSPFSVLSTAFVFFLCLYRSSLICWDLIYFQFHSPVLQTFLQVSGLTWSSRPIRRSSSCHTQNLHPNCRNSLLHESRSNSRIDHVRSWPLHKYNSAYLVSQVNSECRTAGTKRLVGWGGGDNSAWVPHLRLNHILKAQDEHSQAVPRHCFSASQGLYRVYMKCRRSQEKDLSFVCTFT